MQLPAAQARENMRKCRPRWPIASLTSGEFSKHRSHWTTGSIQHNCPNYVIGFATCQDWLEVVWALLKEVRILESALLVSTSVRPRAPTGGFKSFGRIRYGKHLLQCLVLQHESIRAGFKLAWRKVLLQVNWRHR
jgi:hypothetical protein